LVEVRGALATSLETMVARALDVPSPVTDGLEARAEREHLDQRRVTPSGHDAEW
jgi:hypothetical protein